MNTYGTAGKRRTIVESRRDTAPVSLADGGTTQYGHWHGYVAVFADGTAFHKGIGWYAEQEAKRFILSQCHHADYLEATN